MEPTHHPMNYLLLGVGFTLVALLQALYRRYTRISIRHVPGPPSDSFLLGNMREFHHRPVAEADFKWQEEYGNIVRFKAAFGEDRLLVMDPKALQYIYQTAGYNFPKPKERREMSRIISGSGILSAESSDHKRHRKVLLPGFGGPESRAFWPIFYGYATQLTSKWKDIISSSPNQEVVVDIPRWTSRAMLDAIGEAAFDYQFGAMENAETPLSLAYFGLLAKTFGSLTDSAIFVQNLWAYLPAKCLRIVSNYSPGLTLKHARSTERIATDVAKKLIQTKTEELRHGAGNRDIMSLLVKANNSENAGAKLSENELYAQMRTIMLAGHETTANTVSWTLLELSRHPEMQRRLREEIWAKQLDLGREFEARDLESMPYLQAVVKESLRFHPVAPMTHREAGRDDVLPLSKPITLTTGEVVHELPIPKGQKLALSIAGYNRNKDIFGEDSHVFNPDRWLSNSPKNAVNVGVYSNLLTFAGGLRACIGFRFALLEFQAFLVELVGTYEFSLTEESKKIRREPCGVMAPFVEGQTDKEAHLPLRITLATKGEE
ncbi:Cytochrome P450 superfamily protein [Pleurotus pulmonarius]